MRALATILIAGVVLILAVWTADRTPPVDYVPGYPAALGPARPGEKVCVRSEVVRHRLCPTHAERLVGDGRGEMTPAADLDMANPGPLDGDGYTTCLRLPDDATPGTGRVRLAVDWYCNPLHGLARWPIRRTTDTPITILPADPPG